MTVMDPQTLNT